ncbi:MAG: biotin/lipoyl-containing protein [Bacteroidota bacterium]
MIQAVLGSTTTDVDLSKEKVVLNGKEHVLDLLPLNNGKHLHILYNNHSYFIEVIAFDKESKTYTLGFDGKTYQIGIKDKFDQLLHSMGLDQLKTSKVNDVKAPMPGLVLSIKTTIGESVKKGDPILILEAMKMENVIKSPSDGVVKHINVSEKQAVDKNQILITFE